MGYTNPNYPVMEIAINTENHAPNGENERSLEGDIIAVRKPLDYIGTKEANTFLWLLVEGLEENEIARLNEIFYEPFSADGSFSDENKVKYDKRRFCIPLERLKQIVPTFDEIKARDRNLVYQPFLPVDEDTGYFITKAKPLNVHGLIFDKQLGKYL